MEPTFEVGQVVSFEYPTLNLIGETTEFRIRTVQVEQIRDISETGLHPTTIQRRPMLRRGRWLIIGTCLDTNERRMFYFEAMRHVQRESWLSLCLYDPTNDDDPAYRHGMFAPTTSERQFLLKVLRAYSDVSEDRGGLPHALAVFPIEASE